MSTIQARSAFYAGDYERCIEICSNASLTAAIRSLYYRSLIHLSRVEESKSLVTGGGSLEKSLIVYSEGYKLKDDPDAEWKNVMMKAEVAGSLEGDREETMLVLACVYSWANNFEDSYKLACQSSTFEGQLLATIILARINRFDLAERRLEGLKQSNIDEVAFQICEAEVALLKGAPHIKDALYIYQELADVHSRTFKLLNGQIVLNLLLERYSEAEAIILEVLHRNPHDSSALSYLINLSILKGVSSHVLTDQLARLAAANKNAPLLKRMEKYAMTFEHVSSQISF